VIRQTHALFVIDHASSSDLPCASGRPIPGCHNLGWLDCAGGLAIDQHDRPAFRYDSSRDWLEVEASCVTKLQIESMNSKGKFGLWPLMSGCGLHSLNSTAPLSRLSCIFFLARELNQRFCLFILYSPITTQNAGHLTSIFGCPPHCRACLRCSKLHQATLLSSQAIINFFYTRLLPE
jgi:hypothetical protein